MPNFKHKIVLFENSDLTGSAYVIMAAPGKAAGIKNVQSINEGVALETKGALVVSGCWQTFSDLFFGGAQHCWCSNKDPFSSNNYLNRQNTSLGSMNLYNASPNDRIGSIQSIDGRDPDPIQNTSVIQPFKEGVTAYNLWFYPEENAFKIQPVPPFHCADKNGKRDFRWLFKEGDTLTFNGILKASKITFSKVGHTTPRNNPFYKEGGSISNEATIHLSDQNRTFTVYQRILGAAWSFTFEREVNNVTYTVDPEMQIGSGTPGDIEL